MKIKINMLMVLLTIAATAQAISFRDYYAANKASVDKAVAGGFLDLSNKGLTDLIDFDAEHIPCLNKIRTLQLSENELTNLPESIGDLTQLQDLSLNENRLATLPESISKLTHLTSLNLSHNKFTNFSAPLLQLTKLSTLRLNNNQLASLPANIDQMSGLVALALDHNQLTSIPPTIGNLKKLRSLWLHDNKLTTLPETISKLTELFQLPLHNNPIPLPINDDQLRKQVRNVELTFKTFDEALVETKLITAIKNGDAIGVKKQFNKILKGYGVRVQHPKNPYMKIYRGHEYEIDITAIRDANGNNLLHTVVQSLADKIKVIRTVLKTIEEDKKLSDRQKKAETDDLINQKNDLEQIYIKIFGILIQQAGPQIRDMLITRNAKGNDVIAAAIGELTPDSLFVKQLFNYLRPAGPTGSQPAARFKIMSRAEEKEEKEQKELVAPTKPQKPIEKEQEEKKERAQQPAIVPATSSQAVGVRPIVPQPQTQLELLKAQLEQEKLNARGTGETAKKAIREIRRLNAEIKRLEEKKE